MSLLLAGMAMAHLPTPLEAEEAAEAAANYQRYCALCHGNDREGYAADNAPSLRSRSLIASGGLGYLYSATYYGRPGTAMAAYGSQFGGPLEQSDLINLVRWLAEESGVEEFLSLPREPIKGDISLGAELYQRDCASCHGAEGEGIDAPALAHPMFLSSVSDAFIRYAIAYGREDTPMIGYAELLEDEELDALTAFLRSRASGWDAPEVALRSPPEAHEYILHPNGETPAFELREGRFVAAESVEQAMRLGQRMVLLDARAMSDWQRAHIPGAVPVPYYREPERFIGDMPDDGTWIIVYCACPHAASGRVVDALRAHGIPNTAIIDEGVIVWTQRGYPIQAGW
ncbi:MAG: c-type cytochrome [Wenzhouxiangella sp.]|nr:c-type cytochrome [Wenzhouxiangella sp.]TVR94332.1 MAG: cytochrome c, diheme subunit of cytochrome bc complex peta [Wenzhouxiangellaceae bacterium]